MGPASYAYQDSSMNTAYQGFLTGAGASYNAASLSRAYATSYPGGSQAFCDSVQGTGKGNVGNTWTSGNLFTVGCWQSTPAPGAYVAFASWPQNGAYPVTTTAGNPVAVPPSTVTSKATADLTAGNSTATAAADEAENIIGNGLAAPAVPAASDGAANS